MGTTYSVKAMVTDVDASELQAAIDAELVAVNDSLSTYQADSELSRFNQAPAGEWVPMGPAFAAMVTLAGELYALTQGAFDVTIGPLVNLWGFGPMAEPETVPDEATIAAALAKVGFDKLEVEAGALRRQEGQYVDFSAIAKGYGVDRVAAVLAAFGVTDYLVEIGGELYGRGSNLQGQPWRIAIELPESMVRRPYRVVSLRDQGMATSGDYRNYYERDGIRYSHTIDPTTGYPIRHKLASVTVLAETTALADGWATAINVMGAERGLALAEQQGLAVFVILGSDNGFVAQHTPAFAPFLLPELDD